MKKINYFFLTIVLFAIGITQSCTPDSGLEVPSIFVSVEGTPTYMPGETVQYKVQVSANEDLEFLTVAGTGIELSSVNKTVGANLWDASNNKFEKNVRSVAVYFDLKLRSTLVKGNKFPISFTVTDKKGASATSTDIEITVGGAVVETPMGAEHIGTIYNYLSSLKSGWDMVTDVQVSGTATSGKDIWNHTAVTDADYNNSNGFTPAIWAASSTDMVKVSLDYATATVEQVTAAYTSGPIVSYYNLTMSGSGSVFVLKLRGGTTYAILKITGVNGLSKSAPQDDNITFSYKKSN